LIEEILMMRPNSLAHALDDWAAHVEQRVEIGVDDRAPLLRLHAVEHGVARDAGVIDYTSTGPT
jgi:hypothetical protein